MIKIYELATDKKAGRILPLVVPAPISAYLPISITSSIITANEQNYTWIMHNFVQLFKYEKYNKLESFPVQNFMYQNQPSLDVYELNANICAIDKIDIINNILEWIDLGKYVVVYLDEYYIPNMRLFKRRHLLHSQLIFGYCMNERVFKVMNFSNNSEQLEVQNVSFDIVEREFYSEHTKSMYLEENVSEDLRGKMYRILLIQYKKTQDYIKNSLSTQYMLEQIKQYFFSIDSSLYSMYFTGILPGVWGMDTYESVKEMYRDSENNIDIRIPCLMFEHKFYMKRRLEYFDKRLSQNYETVVSLSQALKNATIYFNMKPNVKTKGNLLNIMNEMYISEKEILSELLNREEL